MDKNDSEFKIFYSWQTDSPKETNCDFIRECIDEAAKQAKKTLMIEARRDEATKGVTGAPNIVLTIQSKIKECNLFIADVTNCFEGKERTQRKSPNPNVMFELGYAVGERGWKSIICICNTDYGENLPFDISHNRITRYSLHNKSKKECKSDIVKIILQNIDQLRDQAPPAQKGDITHVVGSYNTEEKKVEPTLSPFTLREHLASLRDETDSLLSHAKSIYGEILELTKKINCHSNNNGAEPDISPLIKDKLDVIAPGLSAVKPQEEFFSRYDKPVSWTGLVVDELLIKKYIDKNVAEDFFGLGALKIRSIPEDLLEGSYRTELIGTSEEKEKYQKLFDLSDTLYLICLRDSFINVCESICYLPIAIQNNSSKADNNLDIIIYVDTGKIINPEHRLLPEWITRIAEASRNGFNSLDAELFTQNFCRLITELFELPEDGNISIETNPDSQTCINPHDILPRHSYDLSDTIIDCKKTIQEHISTTDKPDFYEFHVESLRPNECKWLGYGILIQPEEGEIKLRYQIKSEHSNGNLSGELGIDSSSAESLTDKIEEDVHPC